LQELFNAMPELPYNDRLHEIGVMTGLSRTTVWKWANKLGWKEQYFDNQQRTEAEYEKQLIKSVKAELDATQGDHVSLFELQGKLKDYAATAMTASETVVRHFTRMLQFYGLRLEGVIKEAGGLDRMDVAQRKQFEYFEAMLEKYMKILLPFIAPDKIARLLRPIGLEALGEIGTEVEMGALTTKALQDQLFELGMVDITRMIDSGQLKAHDIEFEEVEEMVQEEFEGMTIPEVDGRKSKQIRMSDDMIKKMLEEEGREKE
jgi:hypothetical protein